MSLYAKAIVAFVTTLLGQLAVVITDAEGFGDVTVNEWLVIAAAVVVTTAAVWGIPNAEPAEPDA